MSRTPWRRRVEPYVRPLIYARARARRGMTLGVRGLVTDDLGRVLLLQHTYIPGWFMPGGGVERHETAQLSLHRELIEEAGVEMTEPPTLLSVHLNEPGFTGDHVLLYRVNRWRQVAATSRGEILELGFFDLDDIPAETTRGTRARLLEVLRGQAPDPYW